MLPLAPLPLLRLALFSLFLANCPSLAAASGQLLFQLAIISPEASANDGQRDEFRVDICVQEFRWRPTGPEGEGGRGPEEQSCKFGRAQLTAGARSASGSRGSAWPSTVSLHFSHTWRQSFAFSLRLWHGTDLLLYRMERVFQLPAGSVWHSKSFNFTLKEGNLAKQLDMRFRVDCAPDFYGPGCDVRCELSDWEQRQGRLECGREDGRKRCKGGWTGPGCDQKALPPPNATNCSCANGGKCVEPGSNRCACPPGYQGPRCEQCVTNARCKGFCQRPGECACPEGKGGQFCEKDLIYCTRHEPCQNGGICRNSAEGDYTCECGPGFRGKDCELRLTKCEEKPCQNGGTCISDPSIAGFQCECPEGFVGHFCQVRAPRGCQGANPCQNGGTCADTGQLAFASLGTHLEQNGFTCHCASGWTGTICDRQHCQGPNPCQNGGICLLEPATPSGLRCLCPLGWQGPNCSASVDDCQPGPCLNGGTCVDGHNSFRCNCPAAFQGELCQERKQAPVGQVARTPCPACASQPTEHGPWSMVNLLMLLLAIIAILALLALLFLLLRPFHFLLPQFGQIGSACEREPKEMPLQIAVIGGEPRGQFGTMEKQKQKLGQKQRQQRRESEEKQPRYGPDPLELAAGSFRIGRSSGAFVDELLRRRMEWTVDERRAEEEEEEKESGIYEEIFNTERF